MTREAFIRKWLGNMEKPFGPENRDNMRDDLDRVIDNNRQETINHSPMTPTHYQFADKKVIDMMAAVWGNEAARMFLTLSAFKYQMRAGRKTDDPTSDLEKARYCLELATHYHVIGWEAADDPWFSATTRKPQPSRIMTKHHEKAEQVRKAMELHQSGKSYREISKMTGIPQTTVYRWINYDFPFPKQTLNGDL